MSFDFLCSACKWTGTQPVLDAHVNPWCPRCGRPVEFADIAKMREKKRPDG